MTGRNKLPLFAAAEMRRRRRARRLAVRRRALLVALGAAGLGLTIAFPPAPRLVWNASASAPLGLYRVEPGAPVDAGDMVVARLPDAARTFAAQRRYLPSNVPLVKRVAAASGARVCALGPDIFIDGRYAATRLDLDAHGRPLPWWHGCRTLGEDEVLLLMGESPGSFDGRYFGPSARSHIVGKARLLWSPRARGRRP